jgi:uncharacterized damage-inducible protein DinB
MSTLSYDQARTVLDKSALPALNAEHPVTRRVIAAIPPDKSDYRPDAVVRSAIDLAWHIVSAEMRFLEAVASGAFDFSGGTRPESIRTPADVVEWYTGKFAKNVERLKQLTGDELTRIVDFRGILRFPAVSYLQVGLSHTIHHRGQLSLYLRPMGAKVPSIYGESFDAREEREARERAQPKPRP